MFAMCMTSELVVHKLDKYIKMTGSQIHTCLRTLTSNCLTRQLNYNETTIHPSVSLCHGSIASPQSDRQNAQLTLNSLF